MIEDLLIAAASLLGILVLTALLFKTFGFD